MKQKNILIVIGIIVIALAAASYLIFDRKSGEAPAEENNLAQNGQAHNGDNNSQLTVPIGQQQNSTSTDNNQIKNNMHTITIETNYGNIEFTTYDADAPKTVKNFLDLANKGFYNGVIFHRVIDGFMIQGGDPNCTPLTGSGPCGAGGPGYTIEDELNSATDSYNQGYKKGVVAMANTSQPHSGGSQFFIMVADYPLAHDYTIFGKVVKGQEVADAIANVQTGANDKPAEAGVMKKVSVK